MTYTGECSNLEASHFSQTSIWAHFCFHVTHSFSYPKACKCRVFRIAIKPCQTILVTLDCSQCRGSRLKKYNRCHNMGGWAANSQSLKCYLLAFAYYQALPPLSRDLLHERKISQAFLLTSFVLHGITWSTSRIRNVLHAVKVLHEIAQSNTANDNNNCCL